MVASEICSVFSQWSARPGVRPFVRLPLSIADSDAAPSPEGLSLED
jgi:hypothetical protein